ncbi:hypothetical protein BC628DRAFT_1409294 [Trametes gibbosa]|nr:hypothetical protein BC628DRAFT_1409294 [Trametes gibbosa]
MESQKCTSSWRASHTSSTAPHIPLLVTARQYWSADCARDDPDALTLVFAHATGLHKEQWEPTLAHLFALLRTSRKAKIRDAPMGRVARAVHLFLAGLGKGVDVDFSKRKLVGVGHSMGATAIILQTYQPPLPTSPRSWSTRSSHLPKPAAPSHNACSKAQRTARHLVSPWKIWDSACSAVRRAWLRTLPTAEYPDKTEGVTLTCTRYQEAASFRDLLGRAKAYQYLSHTCARMPVHFIWGGLPHLICTPLLNEEVRRVIMSDGTQSRHVSDQRVPGAGHAIPQMQPEGLAKALWATRRFALDSRCGNVALPVTSPRFAYATLGLSAFRRVQADSPRTEQ